MEKKFNIEELEKQCLEAENNLKSLQEQLNKAKQKEEEIKQEKLRAEKEARQNELDEAFEKYNRLFKEFIRDYGYYSTSTNESFKDIDAITKSLLRFNWLS